MTETQVTADLYHALAAYRQAAAGLREAFAAPGVLESVYTAPLGTAPGAVLAHVRIVELLTHGWDLAWATGQPTACRVTGSGAHGPRKMGLGGHRPRCRAS